MQGRQWACRRVERGAGEQAGVQMGRVGHGPARGARSKARTFLRAVRITPAAVAQPQAAVAHDYEAERQQLQAHPGKRQAEVWECSRSCVQLTWTSRRACAPPNAPLRCTRSLHSLRCPRAPHPAR